MIWIREEKASLASKLNLGIGPPTPMPDYVADDVEMMTTLRTATRALDVAATLTVGATHVATHERPITWD